MDYDSILDMGCYALIEHLKDYYLAPGNMPVNIETVEDLNKAEKLLLWLSGNISFLNALSAYAHVKKRDAKRNLPKPDFEDLIDKEMVITKVLETAKAQYSAISRAVTIRIEIIKEMNLK